MKIDTIHVTHGVQGIPAKFMGNLPIDVTIEDLDLLTSKFDVAFVHYNQTQPTKREQKAGAPLKTTLKCMMLDQKGGRFRQR